MSAIDMFASIKDVEGKQGEKRLVLTLNGKVINAFHAGLLPALPGSLHVTSRALSISANMSSCSDVWHTYYEGSEKADHCVMKQWVHYVREGLQFAGLSITWWRRSQDRAGWRAATECLRQRT